MLVARVRLPRPGSGESQVTSPKGETDGGPGPPECVVLAKTAANPWG